MISAILLAAGESHRFGAPKLLQPLIEKPLVFWSGYWATIAPVDERIAVIDAPENESEVARALQEKAFDFRFVTSPGGGMASSLAAGVAALDPTSEAVLVFLGDEPFLDIQALLRVVVEGQHSRADVVIPRYRGTRGHPVMFRRAVYPELLALSGDRGARAVADRDPSRVAFVDLDLAKPIDVDTPNDLARVEQQMQHWSP